MEENSNLQEQQEDKLHIGLQILSFCIPLAGAVLYFVYKKDKPNSAKTACYAALIGFGLGIVLNILAAVLGYSGFGG